MNKLFSKINSRNIAIIILIAIFFIVDRYLKNLALAQLVESKTALINNVLFFSFTPNYYMAFSLPFGGKLLTILISLIIAAIFILLIYLIKKHKSRLMITGIFMIFLGAISNIYDRLIFGYVIDYLYLTNFTVFNLADVSISAGAILVLISNNKKPSNKLLGL